MSSNNKWFLILSSLMFALMTMFIKVVSGTIPAIELLFFRFLGGVIGCLLIDRSCYKFKAENFSPIFFRSFYGVIATIAFFYALDYSSISRVTVLHLTYPLFEVIFSHFWIKERSEKFIYFSLPISFLGVYLITNPELGINKGDVLSLLSGIFAGLAIIGVRISRKDDSAATVYFYFSLFGVLITGIPAVYNWVTPPVSSLIPVILVVLFGGLGQVVMSYAYKFCKVGEGSIISLLHIVFSNILGFMFLKEIITMRLLLGELLVFTSIFLIFLKKKEDKELYLE
ncbi:MAG: DMT family transporter [bacterium]|nr:DMT family transporter [bacterium]